jgi:hypothetical protein
LHNDADRKRQEFELAPGLYRLWGLILMNTHRAVVPSWNHGTITCRTRRFQRK